MGTPLENQHEDPIKKINASINASILSIHKKIDYIISQFILFSLFNYFSNKLRNEENNMEENYVFEVPNFDISNKDKFKKQLNIKSVDEIKEECEFTDNFYNEPFVNLKNPVFDTELKIREKTEPVKEGDIRRSYTNRGEDGKLKPVGTLESPDLLKVHNDYKNLEDNYKSLDAKFDLMMTQISFMIKQELSVVNSKLDVTNAKLESTEKQLATANSKIEELKNENLELKKEIRGLNQQITGLNQEITGLRQENGGLRQQIDQINSRLDVSEAQNKSLREENKMLKISQIPSLKIINKQNKRPRYSDVDEVQNSDGSDAELENVSLVDKDSESRKYNLLTGMRDTFSVFTPRGVLTQEKQENELRRAAYEGDINRIRAMVSRNRTIVNGRGMPDSLCSLARAFQDKTALMLASQQGNLDCVKFLLEKGAMVNLCDRDNFTALDYALQSLNKEVVDILREHHALNGADVVNHIKNERLENEVKSFHMVDNSDSSYKLKQF